MKKSIVIATIFLGVLGLVGGTGFKLIQDTKKPIDPTDETVVVYELKPGSTPSSVVSELAQLDLIQNPTIANLIVKQNKWSHIQAGEYELTRALTLEEMFVKFESGEVAEPDMVKVAVPEGYILKEMAPSFAEMTQMSADEWLAALDDHTLLNTLIDKYWFLTSDILHEDIKHPLEGYIYPATYAFLADTTYTIEQQVTMLLDVTAQKIEPLKAQMEASELSIHDIFGLASLIEAETPNNDEMPTVSGVFINRLAQGMKLQSDTTIQYVLEDRVVHVTGSMIQIASPYNTYYVKGLPVGPVGSPSFDALSSVVNPETHDYIFFIGDLYNCLDGKTHFFKTYDQHLDFYGKYLKPSYDAGYNVCKE